jgi:hypothetical protein
MTATATEVKIDENHPYRVPDERNQGFNPKITYDMPRPSGISKHLLSTPTYIFEANSASNQNKPNQIHPELSNRIQSLGNYSDGWNTPESLGPSEQTVEDAMNFVPLLPNIANLPNIGLADDGEISFIWDTDGLYLDLGFLGNGLYSLYAKLPNGQEITVDNAPIYEPLSQQIQIHLI